jgi:DNA-binding transcriptional ArsR family regulator
MESAFAILAEPNRRTILSLLASSERSVGEIERRLRMPQTSVSKHLRVLREAGFVEARVDAQRRVYRLRPGPLMEVDAWLALEKDDPIAKKSRFHRLRIATASGERALPAVLSALIDKGRKNVLIAPAVFCADGASMRALQHSVQAFDDRMTLVWQPGLGSSGADSD